jgi:hypothetical protein
MTQSLTFTTVNRALPRPALCTAVLLSVRSCPEPLNVFADSGRFDRTGYSKRPRERPAPLREIHTAQVGMQPRSPAWHAPPRIRDRRDTGRRLRRDLSLGSRRLHDHT